MIDWINIDDCVCVFLTDKSWDRDVCVCVSLLSVFCVPSLPLRPALFLRLCTFY